jgi:hypothetical protein
VGVVAQNRGRVRSGQEVTATKRGLTVFALALLGSVLLGVIAGLIWGAVAPRALYQEVSQGEAQLVNAESTAFIVADAWFCGIAAVGGLITGILGSRLLVRKDGWPAALGLVLGAVAAAYVAMEMGEVIGLSTFNHQLATAATGTYFNNSLALGAKSALAFWPLVTSAVIALTAAGGRQPAEQPADPGTVSGMWTPGQADGHAP